MLTDALAQFIAFKRWRKLFLIVGQKPADKAYAEAMTRAARKFGLTIAAEKTWDFGPLAQTKGDSPLKADALVSTRGIDYDVAVVADEAGEFGDYIPYRTWTRARSPARRGSSPPPGTPPMSFGAPPSSRIASVAEPTAPCAPSITRRGSPFARSAKP